MFSLLSTLIHIINSIFSGIYTSRFLKAKYGKTTTVIIWSGIYFVIQTVIFDVIHSWYPFSNMTGVVINVLLLVAMQWNAVEM